jgi:hypothetical protein
MTSMPRSANVASGVALVALSVMNVLTVFWLRFANALRPISLEPATMAARMARRATRGN